MASNIVLEITTNSVSVDDKLISILEKFKDVCITISIDGIKDVNYIYIIIYKYFILQYLCFFNIGSKIFNLFSNGVLPFAFFLKFLAVLSIDKDSCFVKLLIFKF